MMTLQFALYMQSGFVFSLHGVEVCTPLHNIPQTPFLTKEVPREKSF